MGEDDGQATVLIVEDEPINQETLVENLEEEGYRTLAFGSGEAAWHAIAAEPERFDVIVLDRVMPDMDGIEILKRVKAHPQLLHTPVIMQTALGSDAAVAEGLRAGAYYYLTKPFSAETLLAIVSAAATDYREYRELQQEAQQAGRAMRCLQFARFAFRSPEEARHLATLAANAAPDPGRVVLGLSELMLNAVEHGNLGIGYAEKSRLIDAGWLHQEIARRLALPEFSGRCAELAIERAGSEILYTIRDAGPGFDWRAYLEIRPDRAFDTHGRGIAMSRMLSFDRMEYRGCGNEVVAAVATA